MKLYGGFCQSAAVEAAVLRQRLDAAGRLAAVRRRVECVIGEADRFARRLVDELQPLARRNGEMRRPIEIGLASAAGERPKVKRAIVACSERSMMSATAVTA